MKRRDLLAGLAAAMTTRAARAAQTTKIYRLAIVSPSHPLAALGSSGVYKAFFTELRQLGYAEGDNLAVLRFSAEHDPLRYEGVIRDAIGASPDVIVTTLNPFVLKMKGLVQSVPIVASMADPIAFGIVGSLAHPEGNITGVSVDAGIELWGKRLGILVEMVPTAGRVGMLCSAAFWDLVGDKVSQYARSLSIALVTPLLHADYGESAYVRLFDEYRRGNADALLVTDGAQHLAQRRLIVELARKARLPTLYPFREYVDIGGLSAYAVDSQDILRRQARYVDAILKGTKPSEMPIYQADKFATVINLKAAGELGITIPPNLLARADDVVE